MNLKDQKTISITLAVEGGFTLLETTIAMVLMMIVALGSASLFSFSIYNNSGGSDRAAAMAIAQQAMEGLRSVPFTTTTTDPTLNAGAVIQNGVVRDGRLFTVTRIVDDNPATPAVEIDTTTTLKRITVIVTPQSIGQGWAAGAGGTITLITQRSMANWTP
ncbi:MAG TPA: hypothetical protein VMM84_16220 [Pyrinomonadaceae bacterium]|nr:hypothetical protein [Pyrinomonadaceae bacterium]